MQNRKAGDRIKNLPKGLDANDPNVQKAAKGKNWGAKDQKRYNKITSRQDDRAKNQKTRQEAKERATGQVTGGVSAGNTPASNMDMTNYYNVSNNDAYRKSNKDLNGTDRAAQASKQANKITGATDRVANLYNATGMDQNYWRNKANAQSNFYLGDIFKEGFGGYDFTMPDSPNKIEDNTKDIYEDAKDEIKDS